MAVFKVYDTFQKIYTSANAINLEFDQSNYQL